MINSEQDIETRTVVVGVDEAFTPKDRQLITSVCRLSKVRRPATAAVNAHFEIQAMSADVYFDIFIISTNQSDSEIEDKIVRSARAGCIAIIVGEFASPAIPPDYHFLPKRRLGGMLLRKLDEITQNQLKPIRRCLVIDDSQLIRTQMHMVLEKLGLKGIFAEDGNGGVLRAKAQTYDAIFLDIMLPDMDGYQVCKILRKDSRTKTTPVIMLTSKGSPFNRMRGAMVGCDRYLAKPVNESQIRQVIEDLKI